MRNRIFDPLDSLLPFLPAFLMKNKGVNGLSPGRSVGKKRGSGAYVSEASAEVVLFVRSVDRYRSFSINRR